MQDYAIRETAHVANRQLVVKVPEWLNEEDVEVIILPRHVAEHKKEKRTRNLLIDKGSFYMSEDFDEELGDQFWTEETE